MDVLCGRSLKFCDRQNLHLKPGARNSSSATHNLLTGGLILVHECFTDEFNREYAEDVRAQCAPCLSQRRSVIFPMFADLDMELSFEGPLTDEMVLGISQTMNTRVGLFFLEEEQRAHVMRMVVCTKPGAAKRTEKGTFKHGIHMHWPFLHVTTEKAFQLRLAMIEGLYQNKELDALLRFESKRPAWEVMVDESVYNTGLRMVGSPKAKRCECKGKSVLSCDKCKRNNNQCIIDPSVYVFHMAISPDGSRDASQEPRLSQNFMYLLKMTSVRLHQDAKETPGFKVYEGAPAVISRETGKKRKAIENKEDRKCVEIGNGSEIEQLILQCLGRHSEFYKNARFKIMYNEKFQTIRVSLQGDGANFCLNKGTSHTSQNVYMEILRDPKQPGALISRMRCWCRKDVVRPHTGVRCCDFFSAHKSLSKREADMILQHVKNKRA